MGRERWLADGDIDVGGSDDRVAINSNTAHLSRQV